MDPMQRHETQRRGSRAPDCSEAEWAARVKLAATYRVFFMLGWHELIFNHITLRVPDAQDQLLINPFGLAYDEVTASNLVKIDFSGKILDGSPWPVNPAGLTIHSAVHANVPDAHCVMHIHTTASVAVACMEDGLEDNNIYSSQLHDMIAYHAFEGTTVHDDEKGRMVASLGDKRLMILRNHGLLAHGATLGHAFVLLWTLNRACEIQLATHSMRGNTLRVDPRISERSTRDALQYDPRFGAGEQVLDALIRRLDRSDTRYRE
ncbi:ribulose-5-phosphate 4-epimerase/fuculose-1-phosphate aldolase [Paraburkholderia caballeronis]|nr:ribulose-5-phosphate 4-epimerase/fuculose-1-phosphate aldolase [Paraburkholderia caballeronis]TDV21509.1 ribulose-5-phosphate 4-epimerase/fuculose-1-phosphate aldolase [Paraburkholderia caballeronis]TDV33548.1 ribulose-5-phosphate 4-epimerase/fuculose-1-phosphate aldolase [Paraburkholderia caballeronis]